MGKVYKEDKCTIEYYNQNSKAYFNNTVNLDLKDLYAPFVALVPKSGKILDAGCGSGRDALFFKKNGFTIVAFDASEKLVKLSSEVLGQPVLHITFEELFFKDEFDGIWACASLTHIPKSRLSFVINKLSLSLKEGGIFYASFKYGTNEYIRDGRLFSCYDEASLGDLLKGHKNLKPLHLWISEDVRQDRTGENWLNVLLAKIKGCE